MKSNRWLAVVAFLLAGGALIVRTPDRNASNNAASLAAQIESEQDHIEPLELAKAIKDGTEKIDLIDLRDSAAFALYHIPGARLMTLTELIGGGVYRNEEIVMYSQGGTHAAQAWVLLKSKNYPNVRTLLGGMDGWNETILYPRLLPGLNDTEKKNNEERIALSLFFGGQPQVGSARSQKVIKPQQPPDKKLPPPKFEKEEEKLRQTC